MEPISNHDLASWVRERLLHHHLLATGSMPEGGGWTPKDDTLEKLGRVYDKRGKDALDSFLSDSINAFLHRTRSQPVKFFINQYLLAKPSLEYLERYTASSHYFAAKSHADEIRGSVMISEQEYLGLVGNYYLSNGVFCPTLGIIRPSVSWILAGELLSRFKRRDLPDCWFEERPVWSHGRLARFTDVYDQHRRDIKQFPSKAEVLVSEFLGCQKLLTLQWLSQHRLATFHQNEFGDFVIIDCKVSADLLQTFNNTDMAKRDLELFSEAKQALGLDRYHAVEIGTKSQKHRDKAEALSRVAVNSDIQRLLGQTAGD